MPNENATDVAPESTPGNPAPTPAPAPAPEPKPAPAAAPAPAPADTRGWVPETLRGHKSLEKFKTPADVAQAYANLEGAFGKKFEEHLKPDADPEIRARVRSALGVPEAPNGYEDPPVPEGRVLDANITGGFKEQAHKLGISKSAAKGLMEWYLGMELERETQFAAENAKQKEAGMAELNKRWGAAAPRNIGLVHQVVAEHGGPELKAALEETGAGNHPAVVAFLAKVGLALAEDNLMTPNPIGVSAADAKAEIAKIRGEAATNPKHPYTNKEHPEHKALVERMKKLNELAHSEI